MIGMRSVKQIIITLILISIVVLLFFSEKTLTVLYKDKIWAHRINNIEKLSSASKKYTGVELDIVFSSEYNYFDVNHPPEKSDNLSLTEYFNSNLNNRKCNYWLDFKNLNKTNVIQSLNKLDSLTELLGIDKKNLIVESTNPRLLISFAEKGFLTSYYLPTGLYKLDAKDLEVNIRKIKNKINEHRNYYISFGYKDYPIIKMNFPKYRKLSWYTAYGDMNKIKARLLLYEILSDDTVDVLLIREP